MAAFSQLLRFTVSKSQVPIFNALREHVSTKASVKTQYFGFVVPNEGFPAPKTDNEVCWFIGNLILFFKFAAFLIDYMKNGRRIQATGRAKSLKRTWTKSPKVVFSLCFLTSQKPKRMN
jgi:hypothetical protein